MSRISVRKEEEGEELVIFGGGSSSGVFLDSRENQLTFTSMRIFPDQRYPIASICTCLVAKA